MNFYLFILLFGYFLKKRLARRRITSYKPSNSGIYSKINALRATRISRTHLLTSPEDRPAPAHIQQISY